jgi:hypothetical protein
MAPTALRSNFKEENFVCTAALIGKSPFIAVGLWLIVISEVNAEPDLQKWFRQMAAMLSEHENEIADSLYSMPTAMPPLIRLRESCFTWSRSMPGWSKG